MPFTKGTVPDRLKGKGIPQQFADQFIAVFNKVKKDGGDEGAAFRQAHVVMNKALRKAGYRQGKDGKWQKGSRKEDLEPEVLTFPSGQITIDEGQSVEQALDSGLSTIFLVMAAMAVGGLLVSLFFPGGTAQSHAFDEGRG